MAVPLNPQTKSQEQASYTQMLPMNVFQKIAMSLVIKTQSKTNAIFAHPMSTDPGGGLCCGSCGCEARAPCARSCGCRDPAGQRPGVRARYRRASAGACVPGRAVPACAQTLAVGARARPAECAQLMVPELRGGKTGGHEPSAHGASCCTRMCIHVSGGEKNG